MFDIPTNGLIDVVADAGAAILAVYDTDFAVQNKADESPLTQADLASHAIIVRGLRELTPEIPVLSEESDPPDFATRRHWSRYWLVDPLDGTKEFVNRNGEFTVNIALIENHQPRFGIVGVPVQNRIFLGDAGSGDAQLISAGESRPIRGRSMTDDAQELVVVASRSHGGERLETYVAALAEKFPGVRRTPVGSSLKLCVLAAGEADCYPRLGPTSEWDIAAAHAVLKAAGGEVYTFDKRALGYNEKESLLNPDFVAVADAGFDWWGKLPDAP